MNSKQLNIMNNLEQSYKKILEVLSIFSRKKLPIENCFEINSSKKFKDVFKKNCYFK